MRRIADVVPELASDRSLRVLVLTGAGEAAFCSGGDLVELSRYPSALDAEAMIALMGDALLALERLPVPVIAAINGYAVGGGSEVAVACDLRIVDEQARMGFVQIRLGLTPGWGGGQRMMRLVGYGKALEILLEGRPLHADELRSLGLANRVVQAGTALQHALNFARQVAQWSPDVVRAVKTLLQAGLNKPYDTALEVERSVFPPLWAADAHLDAVQTFLEKGKG
jgi:enoyl-CoA hydratase